MGFFTPWFFAGILAAGLPIWIHLLRQHRSIPRPFASLMFFERRTQSSIKHRRLKHYLLLALRLLMILLLVLLFANPFIRRTVSFGSGRKLTFIAVDRSFSMRYGDHMERAKREALNVIAGLKSGDLAQIAAVSDRVELLTQSTRDKAELENAVRAIQAGDATSSFAEFARVLRALPKSAGLPAEAHLISDVQRSAMPASFADLALAERLTLEVHPVTERAFSNWEAESVSAPDRVFGNKKGRLQATVAWIGPQGPQPLSHTAQVALAINNHVLETKQVTVPPTGRAEVEFQNVDMPYGANRGEIRVAGDDPLKEDNRYLFSIERADPAKVLYVHETRQSPAYFKAALESGAESAFEIDAVTPDQAANVNLARYAYVVLAGLMGVPQNLDANLQKFVTGGGGLLVALGPTSTSLGRVPIAGLRILEGRYSSREGDRFQSASNVDTSHPALERARAFDGVKFYYAAKVDPGQDRVLAKLSDGTPLIIEHRMGEGRALILTSGFDNITNDLPLHALFVPFVERVSHYLEGGESRQSSITVGSAIELRKTKDRGAAADVMGPDGQRLLSLKDAASALAIPAAQIGFYDVRTASGRRVLVAVNADRRESDLTPIPSETLALWKGTAGTTPGPGAGGNESEPVPQSLWKYVLIALLVAAAAESWLADRFTPAAKEERQEVRKQAA